VSSPSLPHSRGPHGTTPPGSSQPATGLEPSRTRDHPDPLSPNLSLSHQSSTQADSGTPLGTPLQQSPTHWVQHVG
jgi:hypothetical protein